MIAPAAAAAAAAAPPLPQVQKAAQDFEAMAIGQLLAPMFQTADQSKTMFGGGDGEEQWRPMWINALAKQMAANGGIGLAHPIMQAMLNLQEQRNGSR